MTTVLRGSDNFDTAGSNLVKAWVNFNGTGTVAIRKAFNISSITDNGVGDYSLNFTTAMVDVNYGYQGFCDLAIGTDNSPKSIQIVTTTTTIFRIHTVDSSGAPEDQAVVSVLVVD